MRHLFSCFILNPMQTTKKKPTFNQSTMGETQSAMKKQQEQQHEKGGASDAAAADAAVQFPGKTNPKFPSSIPKPTEDFMMGGGAAEGMSIGFMLLIGVLILTVIILNIVGTVSAVKYAKRKTPSENEKVIAGASAVGSWILFPLLSIVPIVMEGNAAKKDKKD